MRALCLCLVFTGCVVTLGGDGGWGGGAGSVRTVMCV